MAAAELPVRVLMLHSRYSTGASSGENRVVEDEADMLRARGHDVILWSPEPDGGGAAGRARMAASAVWSVRAMRTLRDLLGRHRPDVVHAHNLFPMVSPAVLRVSGPPAVVTLHNYRLLCLPATFLRDGRTCESCLGRSPIQGVVHRCYRGSAVGSAALAASLSLHRRAGTFDRVATYIAVSDFVKAKHVEAGWPAERIVVKPNFARPARRRQGPGESFLYLGRLSPEKGLDGLLKAWRRIPARLVVVGDGPERPALEAIAPANVEFAGAVPAERVGEHLERARALVLPSICYEGAPRTVVEAFAAGVPVIASRRGALPDIVEHGSSGLIADPGDEVAWAEAVERLCDDDASIRMGEAALRSWGRTFSPDRSAKTLERIYAAAIQLQSNPRSGPSPAVPDLTAAKSSRISQGTR